MKRLFAIALTATILFGCSISFSGCGNYAGKFHKENWGPRKGKKPKKGKNYSSYSLIVSINKTV